MHNETVAKKSNIAQLKELVEGDWAQIRGYVGSNQNTIKAGWKFMKGIFRGIGGIRSDQNVLAYVDVGLEVYEGWKKLWNGARLDRELAGKEEIDGVSGIHDFWADMITWGGEVREIGEFGGGEFWHFGKVGGVGAYWSKNIKGNVELFYLKGDVEEFGKEIRYLVRERYGRFLELRMGGNWKLAGEGEFKYVPTQLAEEYVGRIRKYKSAGLGRTILFYGPPGTGKSNLCRGIAAGLGINCLSVGNIGKFLGNFSESDLGDFMDMVGAEVIIMDDMDHIYYEDRALLLKRVEELRNSGKVVLGTANKLKEMDQALVRAGRFDEIREISRLEERVVMEMVGGDSEIYAICREFPAAFIVEMMNRVRVEGRELAMAGVGDLRDRVECIWESEMGE